MRYETAFDLVDFADDSWEPFHFSGDNSIPNRQDHVVRDVNIPIVLSGISLVKDGDLDPFTQIVQVRSTQKLCIKPWKQCINCDTLKTAIGQAWSIQDTEDEEYEAFH